MEKQLGVILVGKSLLMEGIAHNLASRGIPSVYRLDPASIVEPRELDLFEPALIVYEVGPSDLDPRLDLLKERPGLRLLGLDVSRPHATLLYSRQQEISAMADLCDVIEAQIGHPGGSEEVCSKVRLDVGELEGLDV